MRILALTRYQRLGSSSRVRFYQYFPYLEARGVELVSAPFFDDNYVRELYAGRRTSLKNVLQAYASRLIALTRSDKSDLLWVEKEILPWFPAGVEAFFNNRDIPYVVDYDDAIFHRYGLHGNPLVRILLGRKIERVMQRASLVIAGNDYLADRAKKAGASWVEILPSVVDVGQYALKQPDTDKIFKIGWIGAPVTAQYLNTIRESLAQLSRETPARLILVGAGNVVHFPEIPTDVMPWTEEIEHTISQKFDVGIMPLADGPFERGKCGYKLIQYMAGGLPVIASPVGVNQQIVEPGINGYLANSPVEWLNTLRTLRDDPQKRNDMGMAGRKKAEAIYNLQVTAPKLLDLFKSVLSS